MSSAAFHQMLMEVDPSAAAEHSVINHHVNGMDYLCLHRSEKLTVKLYIIDPEKIGPRPNGYLVTPHTHRYAFESTVLAGELTHVLFYESLFDNLYERFNYRPETRERSEKHDCGLMNRDIKRYRRGGSYWVGVTDIHTLIVSEPVLLGLIQFSDSAPTSSVYLRKGAKMIFPQSRKPTADEANSLRHRALEMMEA